MPLRIGLLLYPSFTLLMMLGQRGAVRKFVKAKAFSPDTARRPLSLKANSEEVNTAVMSGLMSSVGDGRYFVNRAKYRRNRNVYHVIQMVIAVAIIASVFLLWPPWK